MLSHWSYCVNVSLVKLFLLLLSTEIVRRDASSVTARSRSSSDSYSTGLLTPTRTYLKVSIQRLKHTRRTVNGSFLCHSVIVLVVFTVFASHSIDMNVSLDMHYTSDQAAATMRKFVPENPLWNRIDQILWYRMLPVKYFISLLIYCICFRVYMLFLSVDSPAARWWWCWYGK